MTGILTWEPLVWTVRIALVALVGAGSLVALLLLARFLRPKSIKALLKADIPSVTSIEGEAFGIKGRIDMEQTAAIEALRQDIEGIKRSLEAYQLALGAAIERIDDGDY